MQLQVQLAQFVTSVIEEPPVLVLRRRGSDNYPAEVLQICGVPDGGEIGDYIGGILLIKDIKGLASAVELKVSAPSPNQARQCAESIFAMIVFHQHSLI